MEALTKYDFSFKNPFVPLKTAKAIILIFIIGFVVYGNSLFNGFVWDDVLPLTSNNSALLFNASAAGDYTITLTVTDNNGAVGTRTATVTVYSVPTDKDQCRKDGWKDFPFLNFKNQGDCVSYVTTHSKNNYFSFRENKIL